MTSNFERAAVIAQEVDIRHVCLIRADLESNFNPAIPPEKYCGQYGYSARYEIPDEIEDHIYVYVDFEFCGLLEKPEDPENPGEYLIKFTATFKVIYQIDNPESYPEDALYHFADLNGPYNAWPYWRELVQSTTSRAGMASAVIPVFIPQLEEIEEDEEIKEAEEESHETSD